ncbi:MAG: hypothetical protein EOM06_12310 [Sphingobacteriia bacterium]|nr:hypothetical protein [Sphingobacteriia bacterium]
MKTQPDIVKSLNPTYFWDVNAGNLDAQKSKRLIIERVFSLGNLEEIRMLIDFYGEKQIVDTLCKVNYLDPKTLNFVSKLFKTPLEKFKCYTKAQLTQPLWNS